MSFDTIKGHGRPIKLLQEYMRQNRSAASCLFLGPEGIGKKLTALTLAKALNCESEQFDACDNCPSCGKIERLQHPDLHLIGSGGDSEDAVKAIKIEDIRQLQKDISLRPYEARKKVFILDNSHNLTAEASNALLKILEEPPAASVIILISDKPALVFKTVISRCRIFKFSPLPRAELREVLENSYGLDAGYARFLAYFSEGRLGFALRLKDTQIFSDRNRFVERLIRQENYPAGDFLPQDKESIRVYLNMLSIWFRDMYFIKIGLPEAELVNFDRRAELEQFTRNYSFSGLDKVFKCIADSLLYLEQNINTKLLLSNLNFCLKEQN